MILQAGTIAYISRGSAPAKTAYPCNLWLILAVVLVQLAVKRLAADAKGAGSVGFVGLGLLLLCGLEHRKFWFPCRDELLAEAAPDLPWGYYEFEHPELRPAPEAADLDDEGEPAL